MMETVPKTLVVRVADIATELQRRGIGVDERVTLTVEPEYGWVPGRRDSRARVVAAGLSDDDIDRLVKMAQSEVEPASG